jgi:uncharacterized membrane protein (UPF0127 family)
MDLPSRLRRLPPAASLPSPLGACDVRVAEDPLARLLGLAGLRRLPAGAGLLLPRTHSIHTFGMRFALDLVWLDAAGRIVRIDCTVRPRRFRGCRGARAVIELRACDEGRRGSVVFD